MATTSWVGNAPNFSQVIQATVTAVATNGVLSATINGAVISYTCLVTDTITTAATALFNLLNNQALMPPEINEQTWTNPSAGVILATATAPGTPFAGMTGGLVFSATGGCTITQVQLAANQSSSSVSDARNWSRNGASALPQAGDDVVVSNSSVPLLWDLDTFANVRFNSYTRWQSFTGTIGLPELNPNGYVEYRATYFQFAGPAFSGGSSSSSPAPGTTGVLPMVLGFGSQGAGPTRERYNLGGQQVNGTLLAAGSPSDPFAVRFLGTNTANVWTVVASSLGVAMLSGEAAQLATASVSGSGTLGLGPGCVCSGTVTAAGATLQLYGCAPSVVIAQNGATLLQTTTAANPTLTYPSVTVRNGSRLTWRSPSSITALTLQTSSSLNKSLDLRPMVIGNIVMDADTCSINDPNGTITVTGTITLNNAINAGPLLVGTNRVVRLS